MTTQIRAWHNNPDLKAEVVARLHAHREADEIVQGYDWYPAGPMWHQRIETEYGIPIGVGRLIDDTFEAQPSADAGPFAVEAVEAIPVGADLSRIWDQWHDAQMYDAEPGAQARWLIDQLAAAPIPQVTP